MIELRNILSRLRESCKVNNFNMVGNMKAEELVIKYRLCGKKIMIMSKLKGDRESTRIYSKFEGDQEYKEIDIDTIMIEKLKIFRPLIKITSKYKVIELIQLSDYTNFKLKKKVKSSRI